VPAPCPPIPVCRTCAGARVRPCCILHSEEAGVRDLWDGQRVRLFNDRGSVGLVLKVSDEVQPGNVLVPGQRPDSETVSGTINMLCSNRYTDIGEGATYQSTWLDITAWREIDRSSIERSRTRSSVATPHQTETKQR
jgi:predicted molibdopterin-dependent oxidoreductase YjgC